MGAQIYLHISLRYHPKYPTPQVVRKGLEPVYHNITLNLLIIIYNVIELHYTVGIKFKL